MKRIITILISGLILICICSSSKYTPKTPVTFPEISHPIQITKNGKEHFYASYFGINSFSKNERYATVLETDLKYKLPDNVNEPATLGLVDLKTHDFIPLTQTRAWNFQQGCMAHWLGISPDSLIIYNDYRNGKSVSVIMNVYTKKEIKVIPYPVSAVSPDGKMAASINFSRIRITRSDYGYGGGGQDAKADVQYPSDDGIFLIDLKTGKAKLIVSVAQVKSMAPEVPQGGIEYFNHTLFSRGGSKLFWLARAIPNRNTTAFTVNIDGTNIQRCFPDGWGGSHFDWLNDSDLMITAEYKAKQYSHIFFTAGKDNYERLGNGLLDFDAHGTFSPDGKWMVTDAYPSPELQEQKIYLLNMKSQAALCLGRFAEPDEFTKDGTSGTDHGKFWRCDLHCRWSPKGDIIGFNSTMTGSRQAYIFKLQF
ncbi:MAG: hypothetical protein ABI683_08080 [Ginsengibacter sp.]